TSDSSGTRRLIQDIKIPSGHKIYYRASIFCENHNDIDGILARHRTSNYGGYENNIEVTRGRSSLLLKQWEDLSLIRDVGTGTEGIRFELTVFIPEDGEIKLNADNFLAIDLTSAFGAGNEPTKEECDKIFANWFDGTKSTVSTRIKSVGKNLFDNEDIDKKALNILFGTHGNYVRLNGTKTPGSNITPVKYPKNLWLQPGIYSIS